MSSLASSSSPPRSALDLPSGRPRSHSLVSSDISSPPSVRPRIKLDDSSTSPAGPVPQSPPTPSSALSPSFISPFSPSSRLVKYSFSGRDLTGSSASAAIAKAPSTAPIWEGYLRKKSPKGIIKVWQKRYFRLLTDVFCYYKEKDSPDPIGVIPLQTVKKVEQIVDKKSGCRFDLEVNAPGDKDKDKEGQTRIFSLLANSTEECEKLVKSIRNLCVNPTDSSQKLSLANLDLKGQFWKKNSVEIARRRSLVLGADCVDVSNQGIGTKYKTLNSAMLKAAMDHGDRELSANSAITQSINSAISASGAPGKRRASIAAGSNAASSAAAAPAAVASQAPSTEPSQSGSGPSQPSARRNRFFSVGSAVMFANRTASLFGPKNDKSEKGKESGAERAAEQEKEKERDKSQFSRDSDGEMEFEIRLDPDPLDTERDHDPDISIHSDDDDNAFAQYSQFAHTGAEFSHSSHSILRELSRSALCTLYLVQEGQTKVPFFLLAADRPSQHFDSALRMFHLWTEFEHPFLLKHAGIQEAADFACSMWEYPRDGAIRRQLEAEKRFPEPVVRQIAAEIWLVLEYLHAKGFVASGLCPDTIFFDEDGHALLGDFYLPLSEIPSAANLIIAERPHPEYRAPEYYSDEGEGIAADSWRFGVLLYELAVGFTPFRLQLNRFLTDQPSGSASAELKRLITSFDPSQLRFPPFVSSDLRDLILLLLNPVPVKRSPNFPRSDSCKFLSQSPWNSYLDREIPACSWITGRLQVETRLNGPCSFRLLIKILQGREFRSESGQSVQGKCYVVCKLESRSVQTEKSAECKWGKEVSWILDNNSVDSELQFRVLESDPKSFHDATLGSIALPMTLLMGRVQTSYSIDSSAHTGWFPLIGRDGLPRGEVELAIEVKKEDIVETAAALLAPNGRAWSEMFGDAWFSGHWVEKDRDTIEFEEKTGEEKEQTEGQESQSAMPLTPSKLTMAKPTASANSKRRTLRFTDHKAGFVDLDLSYITARVLCMGSENARQIPDLERFLNHYHGDKWRVFAVSPLPAGDKPFSGRLSSEFQFDEGGVLSLARLFQFCSSANEFLLQNEENVIAVIGKSGKGRCGLLIACFLLFNSFCSTGAQAVFYFNRHRCLTHKTGLISPSQRRYVDYFADYIRRIDSLGRPPYPLPGSPVYLHLIRVSNLPQLPEQTSSMKLDPFFTLHHSSGRLLLDFKSSRNPQFRSSRRNKSPENNSMEFRFCTPLEGDIKLTLIAYDASVDEFPLCYLWFHTGILANNADYLRFTKEEIDGAVKDKQSLVFPNNFQIELWGHKKSEWGDFTGEAEEEWTVFA